MAERRVTARMLEAGRAAFLEKRSLLDDLYDHYPADLRLFLAYIYKAMDAERLDSSEARAARKGGGHVSA